MANKTKRNQNMERWIGAKTPITSPLPKCRWLAILGMNSMKLGKLHNHNQEPWKMPLREYLERLCLKRFGKPSPDEVTSIEESLRLRQQKKEMLCVAGQSLFWGLHETIRR